MRIKEKMLILPSLYIIKRKGEATTTDLIRELTILFNPTGEDAEILSGRNDTKFSQKVRNLVSHRDTNDMALYTTFNKGVYKLTNKGKKTLATRLDELNYLFSQKFSYDETLDFSKSLLDRKKKFYLYDESVLIDEGKINKKTTGIRKRSKLLRDAAIKHYSNNGEIKCEVCGFSFEKFYGPLGENYIEIHHEKPICEYSSKGSNKFLSEAVKNVKPLCANCHRMIHRNPLKPLSIDELKVIVTKPFPN